MMNMENLRIILIVLALAPGPVVHAEIGPGEVWDWREAVRQARIEHEGRLRAWAAEQELAPDSFLHTGDYASRRAVEMATEEVFESDTLTAGVVLRVPVEGFLPATDFDVPRLTSRQQEFVLLLAQHIRRSCLEHGRSSVLIRVTGAVDGSACVGVCGEQVDGGRIVPQVASAWVARARAAAVAELLRAELPQTVVEETASIRTSTSIGTPFRKAVVEVVLLGEGRHEARCDEMCEVLGERVLPRLERLPPRPAFVVGTSAAYLGDAWVFGVEAGIGIHHEDVAFLASVGGVGGPGDTRMGYLLRGKIFFPTLLNASGRFYLGAGFLSVLTGESLSEVPRPTRQHYLGELITGIAAYKGERASLNIEISGQAGLSRQKTSSISGTRVIELIDNRFAWGVTLGIAWLIH